MKNQREVEEVTEVAEVAEEVNTEVAEEVKTEVKEEVTEEEVMEIDLILKVVEAVRDHLEEAGVKSEKMKT